MAQPNKKQVSVGGFKVTGSLFVGTEASKLPTDAIKALDESFKQLGYASDDGVTISEEKDTEEITAWGGDVVRSTVTKYMETCTLTPIETNEDVAELIYGAQNVEVKDEEGARVLIAKHTGATMPILPVVIETIAGENIVKRYVAPQSQLVERGDIALDGSSPDGRELTFNFYPDSNGVSLYEYTAFIKGGK